MDEAFPQVNMAGKHFHIDAIADGSCTMRFETGEAHLRPGGTISGPAMFTLADYTAASSTSFQLEWGSGFLKVEPPVFSRIGCTVSR